MRIRMNVTWSDTSGVEQTREVETIMADYNRWEIIRHRNNWPNMTESEGLGPNGMAWAALKRCGASVPDDISTFLAESHIATEIVSEPEDVDPTRAAP